MKHDLVFICQDHILRFDLVNRKKQKFDSDRSTRHLRFFKAKNGDELELLEEDYRLVIKRGTHKKLVSSEPIVGVIENGNVEVAKINEYATGMTLDVVIVSYRVISKLLDCKSVQLLGDSVANRVSDSRVSTRT